MYVCDSFAAGESLSVQILLSICMLSTTRLFSSTQALSQIFCPRKLAFWEDLTASWKVITTLKQERSYYDLVWHRVLMVIDVARTCRTEEAANVLACKLNQPNQSILVHLTIEALTACSFVDIYAR